MGKTTTGLINVENRHAKPNSIADEELHIVTFNSSFLVSWVILRRKAMD
jgi:hypothetical protein